MQRSWLYSVVEPSFQFCYKCVLVPLLSRHVIQNVHSDLAGRNCSLLKKGVGGFVVYCKFYKKDSYKTACNICSIFVIIDMFLF